MKAQAMVNFGAIAPKLPTVSGLETSRPSWPRSLSPATRPPSRPPARAVRPTPGPRRRRSTADTWTIAGGLTGDPEPPADDDRVDFNPDALSFREIPPGDDVPAGHDDDGDRLPLAEWIRGEADRYQALGTDAGDMVAELLGALARRCERVGATTRTEYEDRWAAIDAPGI